MGGTPTVNALENCVFELMSAKQNYELGLSRGAHGEGASNIKKAHDRLTKAAVRLGDVCELTMPPDVREKFEEHKAKFPNGL